MASPDAYKGLQTQLDSPAMAWAAITAHNTNFITPLPRAIYCSTAGTAQLEDVNGNLITFTLEAGKFYPLRPQRLRTGGSAVIVGLS